MLSRSFMTPESSRSLLAYTPMLHSRLFAETTKFRDAHFQPLTSPLAAVPTSIEPAALALDGNPALDRPLFVQFCANEPAEFLAAARFVAPFCDAVDLNLGCPQGIARKGHYGAFLQEDHDVIFGLVNRLHRDLDVPVTAKIRVLETREATLEYARLVLRAGASILTVHGRTREMKGHKTGLADWKVLRYLREQLPRETVLFANGNILCREDIERCIAETGADGVMSAEGNLYDPSIFGEEPAVGDEGRAFWRGTDGKGGWRMDEVCRRYLDIIHKYVLKSEPPTRKALYLPSDASEEAEPKNTNGKRKAEEEQGPIIKKKQRKNGKNADKTSNPNLTAMQAHLFKLLKPLVARHTSVRDALARSRTGDMDAFENVLAMVEARVADGIRAYHETGGRSWEEERAEADAAREEKERKAKAAVAREQGKAEAEREDAELEMDESSVETVRRCRRPWWVVQPFVRPLPKEALAKGALQLSKKDRKAAEEAAATVAAGTSKGRVEKEVVGVDGMGGEVDIPKDGLVCG